jgi:hypothetical protein
MRSVRDELVTYLEDAGHVIVHGPLAAKLWIDLAQGRGSVELNEPPSATLLSNHYATHEGDDIRRESDDERGAYLLSELDWSPATSALRDELVIDGRASVTKELEPAKTGAALLR